jgi:small subunit ribosomal protein S20
MPNLKSSKKALRQSLVRRDRNTAVRSKVKTFQKRFLEAVGKADKAAGAVAYAEYCSVLDKAAKRGVIKKNNAVRHKTRAAAALRKLA